MYKYIYEPRAWLEYFESIAWYAERSISAAEHFEAEIKEKIANICSNPTRYRNPRKYFREATLKKYPFSIIYVIDKENMTIVIVSIFHQSRHPGHKFIG